MKKTTSKDQLLGKTNESFKDFLDWQKQILGYVFENQDLLTQALTHTSYAHENHQDQAARFSNERLELLGDAVLQLLVTQKLFEHFSDLKEGELSKLRGALVNENTLSELGHTLQLGDWLRLGKGEQQEGGQRRSSLLADGFEALLGAIHFEAGFNQAYLCFNQWIATFDKNSEQKYFDQSRLDSFDAKSRLQEQTMKLYQSLPEYRCEEVDGGFNCRVFIHGQEVASGSSYSKKQLMKDLAALILKEKRYLGK